METTAAPADQIVLEYLLQQIAVRLGGAVDFWTLVAICHFPPDPRGFLLHYGDILRSMTVVAREFVKNHKDKGSAYPLLRDMVTECTTFQEIFLKLEAHLTLPHTEVRSLTEAIAATYYRLLGLLQELSKEVGIQLPYLERQCGDSEDYFRGILDKLFDYCCRERQSPSCPITPQSPGQAGSTPPCA
jgi:hypothetical protein